MTSTGPDPNFRERLVLRAALALRRLGLHRVVISRPARAMAKRFFLSGAARSRLWRVQSGAGAGLLLQTLPGTPQSYWMGMHEPQVQQALAGQLRPGLVAYDCGANIGLLSIIMARLVGPGGRVIAFEPSPENAECLRTTAAANGFAQVTVVPEALWSCSTTLRFCSGGDEGGMSSDHVEGVFGEAPADGALEVPAVSLDDFVYGRGNPPPDFLKLDVEGAEGMAIAGAERVLAEKRPVLLLEIHGEAGRDVWTALQRHGYTCRDLASGQAARSVDEFAVWIRQFLATPPGPAEARA